MYIVTWLLSLLWDDGEPPIRNGLYQHNSLLTADLKYKVRWIVVKHWSYYLGVYKKESFFIF